MKFEEGKSYKFRNPAPYTEGPRDGFPHVCRKAVHEGSSVHASFDCDESEALLTPYTQEAMAEFEEVLMVSDTAIIREYLLAPSTDRKGFFGVSPSEMGHKTSLVLINGEGGSMEQAIIKSFRSGVLTTRDLAAFAACTLQSAYRQVNEIGADPEIRRRKEALGLPR